jgi:hypothetical protein
LVPDFNVFVSQLNENLKKHIFHLAWSPENLPTVDAIYPLLEFLDKRLQEVNRCLLYGNYIRYRVHNINRKKYIMSLKYMDKIITAFLL